MDPVTLVVAGVLTAGASAGVTVVLGGVRWAVRTAVDQAINGKLDSIGDSLDELNEWASSHDRKHDYEQKQLVAWMRRTAGELPDGWNGG